MQAATDEILNACMYSTLSYDVDALYLPSALRAIQQMHKILSLHPVNLSTLFLLDQGSGH